MRRHGGGVFKLLDAGRTRSELLDFSASINPLGLPVSVETALSEAIATLCDYPEIDAVSLTAAIAAHHNLPPEMVLPGNGSTSLIYLLPRVLRPRHATLVAPCFSEYRPALEQVGCRVDEWVLRAAEKFAFDVDELLDSLDPRTDLVWLANPANPSGALIPAAELAQLATALGPRLLVVDEAFIDFCPDSSLVTRLVHHPNLILLRSMTKFYAIPGLRVGYLLASAELCARLAAAAEPWALSTPAIFAARACLADAPYRRQTLCLIPPLRAALAADLAALGAEVFFSVANYLLIKLPSDAPSADKIADRLRSDGVLVRCCADFSGLDDRFLRLAVRSADENQHLVQRLEKILARNC